jgi:nucleotide-binding universal stress UspA family protein
MPILILVDDSKGVEEAVRVAADLARTYGDELIAVKVVSNEEFLEEQQGKSSIADVDPEPIERYENEAAARAKDIVEQSLDGSMDVTGMGRVGDPAEEIIKVGKDVDARFIVIGARRKSPVGKAIFGSTTQSVLLTADRPVVTVMEE